MSVSHLERSGCFFGGWGGGVGDESSWDGGGCKGRISQILHGTGEGGGELEVELSSQCLLGRELTPNSGITFRALKIITTGTCVILPFSCLEMKRSERR